MSTSLTGMAISFAMRTVTGSPSAAPTPRRLECVVLVEVVQDASQLALRPLVASRFGLEVLIPLVYSSLHNGVFEMECASSARNRVVVKSKEKSLRREEKKS